MPVLLTPGSHTVTLEDPVQDTLAPAYWDSLLSLADSYGNYYSNGQSISITSSLNLYANYN